MRLITNRTEKDSGLVGKNIRRYLATTALTATGLIALMSPAAADNWTDHTAIEGSISIDTGTPNTTNITQHTDFTKVQGDGDINAGWTVNLAQPSTSSKYVLYDIENDPTYILGNLNANGQVYIFDQNGVIFGAGSQVNVGAIIASTGTIADADIKADRLKFVDVGGNGAAGNISLNGNISVADAGLAAFVAPGVENNGVINAKMGKVVLASGNTVTLDLYGDNLVSIAADGALENALVKNSGTIKAEGGVVALTAQAAKNAVDNVINMDGIVDVSSVSVEGGKIILGGGAKGTVKVAGKLDASGTKAGSIDVRGQNIDVAAGAELNAISTGAGENGGNVDIIASNNLYYNGRSRVLGGAGGYGGFIETSGLNTISFGDTAAVEGGEGAHWLIDPNDITIDLILATLLNGWLATLGDATITTAMPLGPAGLGNITVDSLIIWDTAAKLNLIADNDIILNSSIVSLHNAGTGAAGSIGLQAANNIDVKAGASILAVNGNVGLTTTNGDIKIGGTGTGDTGVTSDKGVVTLNAGDDLTVGGQAGKTTVGSYNNDASFVAGGDIAINAGTGADGATLVGSGSGTFGVYAGGDFTMGGNGANTSTIVANITGITAAGTAPGSTGALTLNDGSAIATTNNTYLAGKSIAMNGGSISAAGVGLVSGSTITQAAGATMNAGMLAGSSNGNTTLDGAANVIGVLGDFGVGAGKFTLNDTAANLDIIGTVSANAGEIVIKNTGTVNLANTGALTAFNGSISLVGAAIDLAGNISTSLNVVLNALTGAINQTAGSILSGNNLNVFAGTSASLTSATNQINKLKTVTTNGDFSLNDSSGGLRVVGNVNTNGGNVDIDTVGNFEIVDDPAGAGTGKIDAKGGHIDIFQTGRFSSTHADTVVTQGSGTINLWQRAGGSINNAVRAISNIGDGLNTVKVGAGTYNENVLIDQKNLLLWSSAGRAATKIVGVAGQPAVSDQATIFVDQDIDGFQLGDTDHGFHVVGFDSATPASETSAVYLWGNNNDITFRDNEIEAKGDVGFLTRYGQLFDNIIVDNNTFSGTTFDGLLAGTGGYFTGINVPRALVFFNGSTNNDLTTNVKFTNNTITGTTGGLDVDGNYSGNLLVNITAAGATISGNKFDGNQATMALRVRGSDINVFDNDIDGNGSGHGIVAEKVKNLRIGGPLVADGNDIDFTGGDAIRVIDGNLNLGTTNITNNRIGQLGGANSIGSGIGGGDGIFVKNTDNVIIKKNTIKNAHINAGLRKGSGILVVQSDGAQIGDIGEGNIIDNSGSDGIVIRNDGGSNDGNKIVGNTITGATASRTGIYAENATNTEIKGNNVSGSGRYAAIYGYGGSDYTISGNTLKDNQEQGIRLESVGGTKNTISGNFIDKTGTAPKSSDGSNNGNAIHAVSVAGLTISGNEIGKNGGDINGDGVYVRSSNGVVIKSNKINDTDFTTADANGSNGSGIQVVDTVGATIGGLVVGDRNTITNAEWDGIRLQNVSNVLVGWNDINTTGRVGIWGGNVNTATIDDNIVKNDGLGGYGSIHADGGSKWTVRRNDVDGGDYGIFLNGVGGDVNLVHDNDVDNVTADGIRVVSTSGLTVSANEIGLHGGNVGGNGITVINSGYSTITGNNIKFAGGDGIYLDPSDYSIITANTIDTVGGDGIDSYGNSHVRIGGPVNADRNFITNVGQNGIRVEGGTENTIQRNVINGTGTGGNASGTTGAGVYVKESTFANILDNRIGYKKASNPNNYAAVPNSIKGDGIFVDKGHDAEIKGNFINGTVSTGNNIGSGVHVKDSNDVVIGGAVTTTLNNGTVSAGRNTIVNAGWDGIRVNKGERLTVNNNKIDDVVRTGIYLGGIKTANVLLNDIEGTGRYGIHSDQGDYITIDDNDIDDTGFDGIFGHKVKHLVIKNNDVGTHGGNIGDNGIEVNESHGAIITGNETNDTFANGIYVNASNDVEIGGTVDALGNTITRAGAHGIFVNGGTSALIQYNKVLGSLPGFTVFPPSVFDGTAGAQLDGIHVENNEGVEILNNTIAAGQGFSIFGFTRNGGNGANGHGIYVAGSNNAVIDQNNVTGDLLGNGVGAGLDGIHVVNSNALTVGGLVPVLNGNKIFSTGNDGIYIDGSTGALVLNNIVGGVPLMDVAGDGIDMQNTLGTLVAGNVITNVGGDGIELSESALSAIILNFINGSGDDGIDIKNSALFAVALNQIGDAVDNGIQLFNTHFGLVGWNDIDGSGNDGIQSRVGTFQLITENEVKNSGDDGIDVGLAAFTGITNNKVTGAGDDGVQLFLSIFTDVDGNEIEDVADNGIEARFIAFSDITDNKVKNAGDDGIDVAFSAFSDINGNEIYDVDGDGIDVSWSIFTEINDNTVDKVDGNGIEVTDSAFVEIDNNDIGQVDTVRGNGIRIARIYDVDVTNNDIGTFVNRNGVRADNVNKLLVANNTIEGVGRNGIRVGNSGNILIDTNTITDAGTNGIRLHNNAGKAEVLSNVITNSGARGLFASGPNNGLVIVSDNTFTDNPIGAEFESGTIDLTGLGNEFIGGDIALRFAPYSFGTTPASFANLTLVNDGNPAYGGTIGSQKFSGQSQAYVVLANGAFYNPGTPTLLNALNSTYDLPGNPNFKPADFGGVLTQDEYDYLESRFFHFPDGQLVGENLGLFFFGAVPQALAFDIDQKDLFNTFGLFNGDLTGLNVRITGLPNIPGAAPAGPSPFSFNQIQTFAGGNNPADLNNIETAAGGNAGNRTATTSAQTLNAIDTQAGAGQDTQCWGDAVAAAGAGQIANIVYGGSMADNLGQAACGG